MLLFFLIINAQDINHLEKEKTRRRDESDNMKIKLPPTGDTGERRRITQISQKALHSIIEIKDVR
jgi:hypothetical protein